MGADGSVLLQDYGFLDRVWREHTWRVDRRSGSGLGLERGWVAFGWMGSGDTGLGVDTELLWALDVFLPFSLFLTIIKRTVDEIC